MAWDDGSDPYSADLAAAMQTIPIQQKALEAKQRRAQMLMGLAPAAQGATVGRTFVASSPFEHLAAALMKARGLQTAKQAEAEYAPMVEQAKAGAAQAFLIGRHDKGIEQDIKRREVGVKEGTLAETGRHNLATEGLGRDEFGLHRDQFGETKRHNLTLEGIDKLKLDQPHWTFGQDASGGGFLFNTNSNTTPSPVPMAPLGNGPNARYPGKGHDLEKDVQALGKDLESVGQMRADLSTLDGFVGKGEVPGFGPVQGRVPDLVASPEAISARQAAKRIMASYIQMRSGTAASDKEVERLLAANGLGPTATPEAIKQGVNSLRSMAAETVGRIEAKYHPDVVSTYKTRGGVSRDAFQPPSELAVPDDLRKKYGL